MMSAIMILHCRRYWGWAVSQNCVLNKLACLKMCEILNNACDPCFIVT